MLLIGDGRVMFSSVHVVEDGYEFFAKRQLVTIFNTIHDFSKLLSKIIPYSSRLQYSHYNMWGKPYLGRPTLTASEAVTVDLHLSFLSSHLDIATLKAQVAA